MRWRIIIVRLRRTLVNAAAIVLLASALSARAQQLYQSGSLPIEVERIYVKGMDYLAKSQLPAGNWSDATHGSDPAVVGLAVVSMLAHGDDPNFGPYSTAIKRGLDFVLKAQDAKTGYIGTSMYNHGFSTLALAESYGAVDDARIGPALQKAVALIVDTQEKNSLHAWRYSPQSTDADTTVSGAQMVALFAARNAGVPVPETAIQNGIKFFVSMQTPEGGIGYTSPVGPNGPRTAIGCLIMALAKEKDTPAFKAAFEYLKKARTENQYPEYFAYYASQAYFHASPEQWQNWNRDNIKSLKSTQSVDGNWDGQFGPVFATSASLLSLALNYRYLPIYER
jgi:hypothetical protein